MIIQEYPSINGGYSRAIIQEYPSVNRGYSRVIIQENPSVNRGYSRVIFQENPSVNIGYSRESVNVTQCPVAKNRPRSPAVEKIGLGVQLW